MARQAKIYYQDALAGYLAEADGGFTYRYDEKYLNSIEPKPISLTIHFRIKPIIVKCYFHFSMALSPRDGF